MKRFILVLTLLFLAACKSTQTTVQTESPPAPEDLKYLALGDSYTIGESVCESCKFPIQLISRLAEEEDQKIELQVIAKTGWTTSDLIKAINEENPTPDQDFVTLLIGVNNQYQGKDFSLYEEDFPALLAKAIQLAKGNKEHVFVISIPDYAYTPFGQRKGNTDKISSEIDQYNAFAKKTAQIMGVSFINITNITREGLKNTSLVASDGLHPSKEAYSSFVSQILLEIKKKDIAK
ncbi:SGNH/GDSL hydrolase family protein [Galbibacter mesophilus]|uniref:SGNH/GDSL hydrolase family protein n=1 Tax=Galbibacter mesophilus TaxID=379069 RepID=UPI00191FCCE6|nr:SGNH/GDSL hydrolase family protein [Galbibacter mesophilus]MCM5662688.1 SGNH/GDSL hydrolase family protein [Galbibacter mesophilus]